MCEATAPCDIYLKCAAYKSTYLLTSLLTYLPILVDLTLPYLPILVDLTFHYGEGMLPPSTEASCGPNVQL